MATKNSERTPVRNTRNNVGAYTLLMQSMRKILEKANYTKKLQFLDIESLKKDVDMPKIFGYQRKTNPKDIARLADVWMTDLSGALMVSWRDDDHGWVIDGGHRQDAALSLGIKKLWAYVFRGLTRIEEAAMYTLLNTSPKVANYYDVHAAAKCAGDETILAEEKILARYGFSIPRYPVKNNANVINAVKHIDKLALNRKIDGLEVLEKIMTVLSNAWDEGHVCRVDTYIIKGLIFLFTNRIYRDKVEIDCLIAGLKKIPAVTLRTKIASLKGSMQTISIVSAFVMLQQYNMGKTSKRLSLDALTGIIDRVE